eukprot:jgi/Psemu1/297748/fgenesh1_pm.355_\
MESTANQEDDGIWIVVEDRDLELDGMTLVADRESGDIVGLSSRSCSNDQKRSSMPSLEDYPNLQVVDLHNYRYIRNLHESVSNLSGLRRLMLSRCDLLQKLPASIGRLDRLVELDLFDSFQISELPEEISGCRSLKRLRLGGSPGVANKSLKRLPESLGNLLNLEDLQLDKCKRLKTLPSSLGGMKNLLRLSLRECKELKFLPPSIVRCTKLVELNLLKCVSLKSLPSDIGSLRFLEDLNMMKCKAVQEIPHSIGSCEYLSFLDLTNCKSLSQLPDELESLSRLRILYLNGCTGLVEIPELIGELPKLEVFELESCTSLTSIPTSCSKYLENSDTKQKCS